MSRSQILVLLMIFLALWAGGCGKSDTHLPPPPSDDGPYPDLSFGGDATFDVLTWNLKNFPEDLASDQPDYVADIITALQPDVVAFQEINVSSVFLQMVGTIEGYEGRVANSNSYNSQNLAWIWRTATVTVDNIYDIFERDSSPFPRDPSVMELTFGGVDLLVINNHLKCCGDGEIALVEDDEEYRRLLACTLLDGWVEINAPDRRVIIVGDMNDKLNDITSRNVFVPFLDDPDHYLFADMPLATIPASYSWKLQSHLDHILLSDELFADFAKATSTVETIRVDLHMENAMSEYQGHVSDHFPVGVSIDLTPGGTR